MPRLMYTVEQHPFIADAFQFKYESAGKCSRKFLSSGEECFKNVSTKGHKIVTIVTCMAMIVYALKEHDLVAKIHCYSWFLQSAHNGEVYPQLVFFCDEGWFSLYGEVNSQNSH